MTSMALAESGDVLLTASTDCTARLWDLREGSCVGICRGHTRAIPTATFLQGGDEGRLATVSGDGSFRLWGGPHAACTQTVDWDSGVINLGRLVRTKGSGSVLATCHWDMKRDVSRLLLWDVQEGGMGWVDKKLRSHAGHFEGFNGRITCLDCLAGASDDAPSLLAAGATDGIARLFELGASDALGSGGMQLELAPPGEAAHAASVTCVAFCRAAGAEDAWLLAVGRSDGRVDVWGGEEDGEVELKATRLVCTADAEDGRRSVSKVEWKRAGDGPTGAIFLWASAARTLRKWRLESAL